MGSRTGEGFFFCVAIPKMGKRVGSSFGTAGG